MNDDSRLVGSTFYFLVLKFQDWSTVKIQSITPTSSQMLDVNPPQNGCIGYAPIFYTLEDARKCYPDAHILRVELAASPDAGSPVGDA